MSKRINTSVLMSGVDYFHVEELNPYSYKDNQPDIARSQQEHAAVRQALETAGVDVTQVAAPPDCQDGVYTANWALIRGDTAIMSSLPNLRKKEEAYAEQTLRGLGKKIIKPPYDFSGQGDCLACGNYLFCGSVYRTDKRMHAFVAATLGYEVISLRTIPEVIGGQPVTNKITGWPDSFFYDIDLALSVITPKLIAWCPEAFTPESRELMRDFTKVDKIEVSLAEATKGFACNLVSTGVTVVMSAHAPNLKAAIEARGLRVITPEIVELAKGGGYIRCTTLTLSNT